MKTRRLGAAGAQHIGTGLRIVSMSHDSTIARDIGPWAYQQQIDDTGGHATTA